MGEILVKEYLHQIWKRRMVVLFFAVVVLAVTALATFRQPKVYRAMVTVEIGAETPDVAFLQDVVNTSRYGWWSALKYYETQYQIIRTRSLMGQVARRALDRGVVSGWEVGPLTGHLTGGVSVGADERSRLAKIYFDDVDPSRAATLANLIAETYVDENLSQKLQGVTQAVSWLNERFEEIQKEKKKQEEELLKYQEEYKVVSVEDRGNLAKDNLVALTDTLNRLKGQRIEMEAQYRKLQDLVARMERTEDLLGLVNNDLLAKLKHDLAERRAQRSQMAHRYMEKHPAMVRVNAEIEEIDRSIRLEIENEVGRLKTKYLLAKEQEEAIGRALEKQKLEVLKIENVNRKLADIKIVTATNQQLFETLQKRIKEADLSALVRSNNIRIVDRALVPGSPIRPDVRRNLFMALVVGLLGGIGLALALEYMDDTFKTNEDIERYLKMPVLGFIPHYRGEGNGSGKRLEFIPFDEPTAAASEFYRTLRTNILFLAAARGLKKVMVVSTGPGEGKTVTALNLAVTLAQTGERVLIVDLDLRRPKLHYAFDAASRTGLTNVLLGELPLEGAIVRSRVQNLDYLLAGAAPPNPAEVLGSAQMRAILDDLARRYDRVIFDSSPIAPVTDAVVVAQAMDGVLLVVRAAKTHRRPVAFALEQLRKVKAEVLGVVLNDVDVEKSTYANYQYYKYGYYTYGAGESKEKKRGKSPEPQLPAASA